MSDTPGYIKKVEIKSLWGRFDLEWNLNRDVNILAGINGSGKTTLLEMIWNTSLYPDRLYSSYNKIINEIRVELDNGEHIVENLKNKKFGQDVIFGEDKINTRWLSLPVDKVSTFEQPIRKEKEAQLLSMEENSSVKTDLDWELYQTQNAYKDYLITLGKKIEQEFKAGSKHENVIAQIYENLNLFKSIVNDFFAESDKIIDEESNTISFLNWKKEPISSHQLSSGEKQLLIILLKVLVQDNKSAVMFMDEPEISLHVDWQESLISKILALNPNVQLIIATHSPSLIMEGYEDKIVEMNDLIIKDRLK